LQQAGYDSVPATWPEWVESMRAIKRVVGDDRYAILLPINEWTQAVIFGLQAGSPLLEDHWRHGAFTRPAFRRAFEFYVSLYRDGLAPPIANTEISNLYQEFERGYFSMYVTGPWNIGEFRRRLPSDLQDAWGTAPLPGPDASSPGVSLAGGSSLVLFRGSEKKDAAWKLVEFLSRPDQQLRFYELTGNLPANKIAWTRGNLESDERMHAFWEQLQRVVATPKIPEWELIATRVLEAAELAARGAAPPESALAILDRDVERILEKRRWLLDKRASSEEALP
jgi:multiple sugar transport system substrate-binding protein